MQFPLILPFYAAFGFIHTVALTIDFMDDITHGGRVDVNVNDFQHICSFGATLGLNLDTTQREFIS
jgi:hypothetical protein